MTFRSICCLLMFPLLAQTDAGLTGFTPARAAEQRAREARFDSSLKRQNLQEWLKRTASKPHHLGSPGSREVAEFAASLFRSWGYETEIETFYPLFPTPKTRIVEMTAPTRFTAKLVEPPVEGDSTSQQTAGLLPGYHAYSADGDVTGQLVFVNYGVPADYERLAEMGIDVKGKIVLAKYGQSWRGIKPKVAAENGAIACLIYSDPKDDGFFQGDAYPQGAWRTRSGVQRGSVMDMPTYPGDPLTPNVGATRDAKRPPYKEAATLTRIPVLPISWGDAEPLLKALAGPVAPAEWRGALPFTYHIGPGPATVHIKLEFDWKLAPLHNVIARLKGTDRANQWILRGNHHDAWVFGAADPLSGAVALLEEARGVAELAKSGWKPRRTIIYCLWDGEEPALLGSTEWAEHHAAELKEHAAVYINTDATSRGFFSAGGSHALEKYVNEAARDLTDPQTKRSVAERQRAARSLAGPILKGDVPLSPLGSGSDYTPFLQHLGISSLNFGFGGEGPSGGVYHSTYDSYDHFTKFVDPDFQYMLATTQIGGRLTLRLADADVLPFRFDGLARTIAAYATEVQKLADTMRTETQLRNEKITAGVFRLAADPRRTYVEPKPKDPVPPIDFAPLTKSVERFRATAERLHTRELAGLPAARTDALDRLLFQAERALTLPTGLPRRPWYRHQIYAPGYYTGYGVKTLPGIREAIEERQWAEARQQIQRVAAVLDTLSESLDRAARLLN